MADPDSFLPLAAALSDGQRAGLQFVSLYSLLLTGSTDAESVKAAMPDISSVTGENKSISIYSGINRAIFRNGVALTNAAMMEKSRGNSPYNETWDEFGIVSICSYYVFTLGAITLVGGFFIQHLGNKIGAAEMALSKAKLSNYNDLIGEGTKIVEQDGEEVGYLLESVEQKMHDWVSDRHRLPPVLQQPADG